MNMDIPRVAAGQGVVLCVDVRTGIVLNHDRGRYIGVGEVWHFFESLQAAREFAVAEVAANPHIECVVYDASGQVEVIRDRRPATGASAC